MRQLYYLFIYLFIYLLGANQNEHLFFGEERKRVRARARLPEESANCTNFVSILSVKMIFCLGILKVPKFVTNSFESL